MRTGWDGGGGRQWADGVPRYWGEFSWYGMHQRGGRGRGFHLNAGMIHERRRQGCAQVKHARRRGPIDRAAGVEYRWILETRNSRLAEWCMCHRAPPKKHQIDVRRMHRIIPGCAKTPRGACVPSGVWTGQSVSGWAHIFLLVPGKPGGKGRNGPADDGRAHSRRG